MEWSDFGLVWESESDPNPTEPLLDETAPDPSPPVNSLSNPATSALPEFDWSSLADLVPLEPVAQPNHVSESVQSTSLENSEPELTEPPTEPQAEPQAEPPTGDSWSAGLPIATFPEPGVQAIAPAPASSPVTTDPVTTAPSESPAPVPPESDSEEPAELPRAEPLPALPDFDLDLAFEPDLEGIDWSLLRQASATPTAAENRVAENSLPGVDWLPELLPGLNLNLDLESDLEPLFEPPSASLVQEELFTLPAEFLPAEFLPAEFSPAEFLVEPAPEIPPQSSVESLIEFPVEPVIAPGVFHSEDAGLSDSTVIELTSNEPVSLEHPMLPHRISPFSGNTRPAASLNGGTWYLGLDIGTTGISAVLLDRTTQAVYPIYWLEIHPPDLNTGRVAQTLQSFRLPMVVYEAEMGTGSVLQNHDIERFSTSATASNPRNRVATTAPLQDFKPALKIAVPYFSPQSQQWEPVLQWSATQAVSLSTLHQGLRQLLARLTQIGAEPVTTGVMLSCGAVGLEDGTFQAAMHQLAGVIVGYPVNWSDTYTFNLREAILGSRLVLRPEQIYFLEDAIATLLAELPAPDGRPLTFPPDLTHRPGEATQPLSPIGAERATPSWHGNTLILNAGASVTDFALVHLPDALSRLSHRNFVLRSLPYAGNALDQDIICHLLYPAWVQQVNPSSLQVAIKWRLPLPPGRSPWELLGWDSLEIPAVGEPDGVRRQALQQRLCSHAVGRSLLDLARLLKVALQQRERVGVQMGDTLPESAAERTLVLTRQDLGSSVLLFYVQRLNRELNALLKQSSVAAVEVSQVICSGGSASFGAIARWLRQKLPNAVIVQDTYTSTGTSTGITGNAPPPWSRVAYGLATLPLHPGVLDAARQQYSDYYLLLELLRTLPDAPLSFASILQRLERQGIETQACQSHLLALLEGHLPPGLVPTQRDYDLLNPTSQGNPDYQVLLSAPLFLKQENQTYRPNPQQWQHFRRYLDTLLTTSHQKLTEPLWFGLEVT